MQKNESGQPRSDPSQDTAAGGGASEGGAGSESGGGVLTEAQRQALADANRRLHKVLKAGRVASFNGWTLLVLGGLSVMVGLLGGGGLWVGAGAVAVGWNELEGRKSMNRLEPNGLKRLIWNQAFLVGLVAVYSLWQIYVGWVSEDPMGITKLAGDIPEVRRVTGDLDAFYRWVTVAIYGTMIVSVFLCQGLVAWYYFSKQRGLTAYLRQTPNWVTSLQRDLLRS